MTLQEAQEKLAAARNKVAEAQVAFMTFDQERVAKSLELLAAVSEAQKEERKIRKMLSAYPEATAFDENEGSIFTI